MASGSIPTASTNSDRELVWWYAPEVPDGFNGRWLRRHGERGPEVSKRPAGRWLCRHVERCPEGLDRLLEVGSVVTVLRSLMGSEEDGSVVTW